MVQGTTPTLLFKFSFDLALAKEWRIIFYQDEENNFAKTQNDCIVDENQVIYIKLTQEETLSFDTNKYLKIQAKALTNDNNVIPSDTITTHIHEILDKALFEIENTPPTIIDTSVIEFHFNEEHCQYGLDFEDLYIEKVAGGSDITVDSEFSLTSTNPVQNKVITKKINELQEEINNDIGQDGKDGVGIQSVEQTTTSTEDNGKNIITVTLTNGNKSTFVVENGSQGSQGLQGQKGEKGTDGYTPVKGKDYFTIEDVQNIVNQVIATLPIEQEVNDSTNPVSSVAVHIEVVKLQRELDTHINSYDQRIGMLESADNSFYQMIQSKQDKLTFDSTPTQNSTNPITSGAVKTFGETLKTKRATLTDTTTEALLLEDNTVYNGEGNPINNLSIDYPTTEFMCELIFTVGETFTYYFPLGTRYVGKAPDFKNGETWELNIHNGIVASGKVVSE